ncbi:MAG: RHS repeat-associated core domain-containing protein, partial [Spirochaetaceae bacterium]|nr:RHS repeat-associated core domain-containing protein [Spirochaetaceae bacterium]
SFGYTGKAYDIGTGLYDYGFRDYSPNNARFTTIDPIRDGSNWFSYVVNDPVNYCDPFGLSASDSKWTNNGDGTYTAKPGATLWGLQQETGVNWQDFGFDRSPETLQVGETITVHGSTSKATQTQATPKGNTAQGQATSLQSVSPIFSNPLTVRTVAQPASANFLNSSVGRSHTSGNSISSVHANSSTKNNDHHIRDGIIEMSSGIVIWGLTVIQVRNLMIKDPQSTSQIGYTGVLTGATIFALGIGKVSGASKTTIQEDFLSLLESPLASAIKEYNKDSRRSAGRTVDFSEQKSTQETEE